MIKLPEPAKRPTMYFVGVTTGQSSIMKMFPIWAKELGLDAEIKGIDLPIHAPAEDYRAVVQFFRDDPLSLGALEAGRLCGAGIDAFSSEPPKDPRWFTLDNVVLGSHCAASTAGASRNMGRMATANLIHDLGL